MKITFMMFLGIISNGSNSLLHWLEHHLLSCPFKQSFGIDCPGCGIQRSFLAILNGDIVASFKLYPATIPLMALLIFTVIHLKFDFAKGALLIKVLYSGIAIIIVINYIYKIFSHQLF